MLDLQLLHQFVVVAEHENVGRAARALHMSASPLSRRVLQLEAELGLTLFARDKKRLRLTAAGSELLADARTLLSSAQRVERRAQGAAAGVEGSLMLGFVEGAVHAGVLPRALRAFSRSAPNVRVELRSARSAEQLAAVCSGALEGGLVYTEPASHELESRLVVDEPFVLVVPRSSTLTGRRWKPDEVSAQPFLALPERVSPSARGELLAACASVGITPDIRFEVSEPSAVLRLVAAGVGVAIVQASLGGGPGVRSMPLPARFPLRARVFFVRRRGGESPLLARFEQALIAAAAPSPQPTRRSS